MKYCDHTFPEPEENLACDEALLDQAEAGENEEILRTWEPKEYFVAVGYGNEVGKEVEEDFCERNGIEILRRCTGGGTVLQGAGVLNYSLILNIGKTESLGSIASTNSYIMDRNRAMMADLLQKPVEVRGHTDLVISGMKFSGNAQRRKKNWLLFHGAFLIGLNLELMEQALAMPSKEPCYREGRSHLKFVTNLGISTPDLKAALVKTWQAEGQFGNLPLGEIRSLIAEKYGVRGWNRRL